MEFTSKYVAKKPDKNGHIHYTEEENSVWHDLIMRQHDIVKSRACDEYLQGLDILNFSNDRIPQCYEMNEKLSKATGWTVEPVEALIPTDYFFQLLSSKKFPAACFIRKREELDYLQEPDIFHEFFGHCPLITHPIYADFMQKYGKIALEANEADRDLLGRLYWFTIEFGLIKTAKGLRCYGGGILSSKEETIYAIDSNIPQRKSLNNGLDALRTPYRIDILQPIYYVIDNFQDLFDLLNDDIIGRIQKARQLGEFEPLFDREDKGIEGHVC